jgi:membrane protein DedA with SNARE-associated domain
MPGPAAAALLPSALTAMPTAAIVGVLCVAALVEVVLVPTVLPGATITLLAGALIGVGRPAFVVVIPLAAAIIVGDQLAYFSGAAITNWWRRRRHDRRERRVRRGPVESWFAASMPSLAGAAGLRYQQFAPRALVLRVPWLGAALGAGTLAAKSVAHLGHVIGLIGLVVTALVVVALVLFRRRASLDGRTSNLPKTLPPGPARPSWTPGHPGPTSIPELCAFRTTVTASPRAFRTHEHSVAPAAPYPQPLRRPEHSRPRPVRTRAFRSHEHSVAPAAL